MTDNQKYYGKYRGTVANNIDPMKMGRIQVMVPDVSGSIPTSWALPCVPVGGIQMGIFAIPLVGTMVWIEFEKGNPDYPIWTGSYWGSPMEVPVMGQTIPLQIPGIAIQTPHQNGIIISDAPGSAGGILIKTATGASISVNDQGIVIENGKGAIINMVGPIVDINSGALTITQK